MNISIGFNLFKKAAAVQYAQGHDSMQRLQSHLETNLLLFVIYSLIAVSGSTPP